MSRSNPRAGGGSPIKKYLTFSGGTGTVNYFDKNLGEKGEKVELEKVSFTVLDVRSSISGYEESTSSSFSSNLIVDSGKEELRVVKFKKGKSQDVVKGLYKDIKEKLKGTGAKFTTNIIALADVGDGEEIVNIQINGAALNNWIEFTTEHSNNQYYDYKITISKGVLSKREEGKSVPVTEKEEKELDAKLKKNPRSPRPVWFYTAQIDFEDLTPEEIEKALEEDKKVQDYFNSLSSNSTTTGKTGNVTSAPEPNSGDDDEDDDLPF